MLEEIVKIRWKDDCKTLALMENFNAVRNSYEREWIN